MKPVERVTLIRTSLATRGAGVEGDPIRSIEQYWDDEGNLVIERDIHVDQFVDAARELLGTHGEATSKEVMFNGRKITLSLGSSRR